jgi:hypothetical protein
MIPGLAAILHAAAMGPLGGYDLITASQTYQVKAGVTSICALAIGMGGPYFLDDGSGNVGSGGGGAAGWRNAIPVTPLEFLQVSITPTIVSPYEEGSSSLRRGGTTLVGAGAGRAPAAGSPFGSGVTGFAGGQGAYDFMGAGTMEGAGAGGKSAGQASNGSRTRRGGGGANPFAIGAGADAGASPNLNGLNYGGGAAYGGTAGPGCVLIMWGDGLSFPDNIVST